MKVVDAGVIVELVAGGLDPSRLGSYELITPHLVDSEVTNVLRRLVLRGTLTEHQGQIAMDGFSSLTMRRFAADWLRPRIWELRHNVSGYGATYVALAEMTGATSLLTTDAKLANAPGIECPVELL
ncbi:type II toxin-antitoxin system VapC family toxin [Arthrobacter monumenti]